MTTESLSELQSAFSDWRRIKKSPRERIPAALLGRAQRAAVAHGVGPVAYRLQVGADRLRTASRSPVGSRAPTVLPAFTRVEIADPSRGIAPLVEAETRGGIKLRVFQVTTETAELLASFCRSAGGGT